MSPQSILGVGRDSRHDIDDRLNVLTSVRSRRSRLDVTAMSPPEGAYASPPQAYTF